MLCRHRTLTALLGAVVCFTPCWCRAADDLSADRKPNIVLIMADDLGAECLGCYGGTSFRTPVLDKLARTGVRFNNCYATPVCITSRMQLMTGRYPFRTGWTSNTWGEELYFDPAKETSFAQLLRSAGYATCVVDKWMLSYDFQHRPQVFREAGFDEHYMWRLWDTSIPRNRRVAPNNPITSGTWDAAIWQDGPCNDGIGHYGPDLFCQHLIDFIERHQDKPFLAYWPMHLVHTETVCGRTTPPTPDTLHTKGHGDTSGKNIDKQQGMADMIFYMDKLVGRVVSTLDRLGIRGRTLILFTGDNGTTCGIRSKVDGNTVLGGKGHLSEAGCRVPLLVNWQGTVPGGRALDNMVDFTDFLPTMAEAAGADLPAGVKIDGQSFLAQAKGQAGTTRSWVYCHLNAHFFIRDKRWMLHDDGRLLDLSDRYAPHPAQASAEADAARCTLQRALRELRE